MLRLSMSSSGARGRRRCRGCCSRWGEPAWRRANSQGTAEPAAGPWHAVRLDVGCDRDVSPHGPRCAWTVKIYENGASPVTKADRTNDRPLTRPRRSPDGTHASYGT
jgi:hypothetical protein